MSGRNCGIKRSLDQLAYGQQELVELAALMDGTKPVMRVERPPHVVPDMVKQLAYYGLIVVDAPFHVTLRYRHALGDDFVAVRPGTANGNARGVYYIARQQRSDDAIKLADLEQRDAASPEVGLRLGYPPCCVAAYLEIARGRDWIVAMLDRTPHDQPGFVSCNRLARLFGEWAILPDYYPCSFVCTASASWAVDIVRSARAAGLGDYVEAALEMLRCPLRLDRESILQLSVPPRIVAYSNPLSEARVLWWM